MANYTQSPQASFSQFVPQINPDQYGQALLFKQQQFDEGIRRIQGYVDTVSGIEVVNPKHKEYLDTKIGQLKSQIQTIAASDFTTQAAIGKVSGFVGQIAKDPTIQSAIISTQNHKKNLAAIEKARLEGKSSSTNEADYLDNFNNWVENGDISTPFQSSYSPYVDVRKKALEVIKQLSPSSNITEDSLVTDANGNIVKVLDVTTKKEIKGIGPDQIRSALAIGLDERDYNQLAIDGRQSFKNLTASQLVNLSNPQYSRTIRTLEDKIKTKKDQMSTAASGATQLALQAEITQLESEIATINKEIKGNADVLASGNLTAAKERIYQQQFLNNFANAFAYQESSSTFVDNPWMQVQLEKEKLKAQAREQMGGYGVVPQSKEALKTPTMSGFISTIEQKQQTFDQTKNSFLSNEGRTGDERWYQEQKKLYETGAFSNMEASVVQHFKNTEHLEAEINQSLQLKEQIEQEANNLYNLKQYIPTDAQPLRFKSGEEVYTFTPEEIVEFNTKLNNLRQIQKNKPFFGADKASGAEQQTVNEIVQRQNREVLQSMTPKERLLHTYYNKSNKNKVESNIKETIDDINARVNSKAQEVLGKKDEFISQQLAERTRETDVIGITFPTGDTEKRDAIRSVVQQLVDRTTDTENEVGEASRRFEIDEVRKALKDDDATYTLQFKPKTLYGESSYIVRVSSPDVEYQEIPITAEEASQIFPNQFRELEGANVQFPFVNQIAATKTGTTNFAKPKGGDITPLIPGAYLQQKDFKNVNLFSLKGDIVNNGSGEYALQVYVYDPLQRQNWVKKQIVHSSGRWLTQEEVNALSNNLEDQQLYQLLYKSKDEPVSASELQALKLATQKPQ